MSEPPGLSARIVQRSAARVVLLDPSDCVLLMALADRRRDATWWVAPGGGLEEGETHEQAAAREIVEETGFTDIDIGPWIWARTHRFPSWDADPEREIIYEQEERFFLARTDRPRPRPEPRYLSPGEEAGFRGLRWWTIEELEATEDELAPAALPSLLRSLVVEGLPEHPLDVGV